MSELNAIILKACQHDPEKRHASASALREELERLQRGRSVKRHRAWQRRWDRARKLALPAALGIVGAMALAALWRLQSGAEAKTESPEARSNLADQGTSTGLDPRAIFILPLRPTETNGAPLDLCSRITDAFIDSLGLLTNQGITVGPRKSGWAHLPESEQFQRVTNEFRMRHALTGKVGLADDQYALTLGWWDLELGQPRWTETFRGGTNELIELERQALVMVARAFDLELTPDQDRQISQLLTNNLEALGYLRKAKAAFTAAGRQPAWLQRSHATYPTRPSPGPHATWMPIASTFHDAQYRPGTTGRRSVAQHRPPPDQAILRLDDTLRRLAGPTGLFRAVLSNGTGRRSTRFASRCTAGADLRTTYHWFKAWYLRIDGQL